MPHSLVKFCGASAVALMMELSGLVPAMQAPRSQPTNPSPRPANPTPRPSTLPTPTTPRQPTDQTPTNPNNPNNPNQPNMPTPGSTINPANTTTNQRFGSPFSFSSPQMQARFNENNRRLVQLEQQLSISNQELVRRLGAARQLSGERQTTAMFDIMQQILQNNAQMNQYLAQARMGWAGELEGTSTDTNTLPGTTPGSTLPGTTPGSTLPGTTPGNTLPGTTPATGAPGSTAPSNPPR